MKKNKIIAHLFACSFLIHCYTWAMQINEEIIKQHQESFQAFINDLEGKLKLIPRSSWVPGRVLNFALKKLSALFSHGTITLEDVKFLDRFFQDKEQAIQIIKALANYQENIIYLNTILDRLQQADPTFENFYTAIEAESQKKLGTKKDVHEKNKNGEYLVNDATYFNYTACNLFISYLWDKGLIQNIE